MVSRIFRASVVALISLTSVCVAETAEPDDRPNVLLIAIDDLNDWVECLSGHADTKTPNIDRLAERGVLFTNAPRDSHEVAMANHSEE